nr:type II toxin-antitoxin system HipA family toxin [Pseudobdellovibrio exovorus]
MVYLGRNKIGMLKRRADGSMEFRYEDNWVDTGYAISLSLPLADRVFLGERASFFFDNLLPDNKRTLEAIAEKFDASSTKSFDILAVIGRECVGALSFFDEDDEPVFLEKMSVRPINEENIARRLRGLASENPLGMDEDGDFRISIAGAQEKMALLYRKNKWWEPRGISPTSHILKKSIGTLLKGTTEAPIDFEASVDNEWISLKLAKQFKIEVASAEIKQFEDQRVLSVERFDRQWQNDILVRIPQEDFCQATGTSPVKKYEKNGGPSLQAMMNILSSSANAEEDRKMLFKTAMFNDLIHNTDSHAKNFSLFHVRKGYLLTPMYDLLSAHFLKENHKVRYENLKSSLRINEKEKYVDITLNDWQQEAQKCGLSEDTFEEITQELKSSVAAMEAPQKKSTEDLDLKQQELILEGVHERSKKLWTKEV